MDALDINMGDLYEMGASPRPTTKAFYMELTSL